MSSVSDVSLSGSSCSSSSSASSSGPSDSFESYVQSPEFLASPSRDASPERSPAPEVRPNRMSTQWCFTFNNYSMDDVHRLRALHTDPRNKLAYICFQPELAPNTGTPHLQGFIAFESRKRFSTVKRLLGDSTHLETPRGTPEQNRTYCSKDESRDNDAGFGFHEAGDLPPLLNREKETIYSHLRPCWMKDTLSGMCPTKIPLCLEPQSDIIEDYLNTNSIHVSLAKNAPICMSTPEIQAPLSPMPLPNTLRYIPLKMETTDPGSMLMIPTAMNPSSLMNLEDILCHTPN